MDVLQREKILASYFATKKQDELSTDFKEFIYWMIRKDEYNRLKHWWDDMEALTVLRAAEYHYRNHLPEMELPSSPIECLSVGENGLIQFMGEPIGISCDYYRTVFPQEIQIRVAYDSLIERFIEFLQRKKNAICLSENRLAFVLFIPYTDFQFANEWQQFVRFAYSEEELYKSFTLFVNSMKLTNRGFGYVHFPSVTESMKLWQAAFYIATLEERVIRYPDNYRKAKTDEERGVARKANRQKLKCLLTGLRDEVRSNTCSFDKAIVLSRRFNRTGSSQFSYGTVKPRSNKGKIEDKIIDILNEPLRFLTCPLAPGDEIADDYINSAGDTVKTRCYSCGRHLPPKSEIQDFKGKLEANRFVFSDPSQRLQSGSRQDEPSICLDCLTVAFGCPIKLSGGAITVHLSPRTVGRSDSISREKYLRMLTLGELNLIAGRYLVIKCNDFIGSTPVSNKIGQVQYALWRIAQTLPVEALNKMYFTLFADELEIRLETRHLVWLSYLYQSFSARIIVNGKDNVPLGQAIRLIQKDEVISAIYKLVTAKSTEAKNLSDWSYSEKRELEELREKHCSLLVEQSSKGDTLMTKQADFYRDVAALTGLTYAYCDYLRSELRRKKESPKTIQREVKKLIEKVVNPSFFNYEAADVLPGTRATMYCSDDNYFCYAEAKRLLKDTLKLDLSSREGLTDKGQESLTVFFDDVLNGYAALYQKHCKKAQQRRLSYQLKLNLHAKFAPLFNQKGD